MEKTVLITGAASGIGRATAEVFARKGWNVVASARDPSALSDWAVGAARMAIRLDVTDESSIADGVAAAVGRYGHIDVLVNNAGYGVFGALEAAAAGQLEEQFRTNTFGAAAAIRHVLPHMRARRSGVIVNVSSLGGRVGAPFYSLYCSSKFALEGLSESLRFELAAHDIRVKLIEPGHFKTDFLGRSLREMSHDAYEREFRNHMAWVHRSNEGAPGPERVAGTIFRAATDGSRRLRYPVRSGFLIALSQLLPDRIWNHLMSASLTRQPAQR